MNIIYLTGGIALGAFALYKIGSSYIDRYSRRAAAPPPPPAPEGTQVMRNIAYSITNQGTLLLDIYQPIKKFVTPMPVIMHIHGGGWNLGSKDAISIFGWQKLAQEGYAVVTINYRLSDQAKWPAQIHDCKKALRWIRKNADKYNFDPDRIGIMGVSAGGHLTSLMGTSGHTSALDGEMNSDEERYSGPVQAIVDVSGPTDLGIHDEQRLRLSYRYNPKGSIASRLLGESVVKVPHLVKEANPITYVKEGLPPFLIIHGDNDHVVAPGQARILHDALRKNDNTSELIMIKGAGHTSTNKLGAPEIYTKIKHFLDRQLMFKE